MAGKLEESARSTFAAQLPEGYLIVDKSYQYTYSDLRQAPATSGKATLAESLTATVAVIKSADAAEAAAKQPVSGFDGSAVAFQNPDKLAASAADGTKPVGPI